jgi:hypothetical protein
VYAGRPGRRVIAEIGTEIVTLAIAFRRLWGGATSPSIELVSSGDDESFATFVNRILGCRTLNLEDASPHSICAPQNTTHAELASFGNKRPPEFGLE